MPDDYIRKQTLVNAERYITPELKDYESLILNAEERLLEIEQRLFAELCDQIAGPVGGAAAHGARARSPGRVRVAGGSRRAGKLCPPDPDR